MQDMRGVFLGIIGVVLAAGVDAPPAAAQSKNEIIKTLVPMRSPTRGISVESATAAPGAEKNLPKINLTINFEPDSERLTPTGQKLLDELGEALQDPSLKPFRFMIAGHTDGVGSDLYNLQLSERRAAAVKRYLVGKSQVEEARLTTVGYGKSRPLDAANPMSAENRRVEIINLLN